MTHPGTTPFFQFVVLRDVEFPMTDEADHADRDQYHAHEEPRPIHSPESVHEFETVIQDDGANPCKDHWAKQALTRGWAGAGSQVGLMPTCSFDGHAGAESGLGLRLMGRLYVRGASSMDDGQKLDVLALALRTADGVVAHHVIIPLKGGKEPF